MYTSQSRQLPASVSFTKRSTYAHCCEQFHAGTIFFCKDMLLFIEERLANPANLASWHCSSAKEDSIKVGVVKILNNLDKKKSGSDRAVGQVMSFFVFIGET